MTSKIDSVNTGRLDWQKALERAARFHGYPAPGVMAGCVMVDMALRRLPHGGLYDAICETGKCLPDAVQLLTPCTIGNGWLRIIDLGRFAVCLYDKSTGKGIRVSLDARMVANFHQVQTWFLKLAPKQNQNSDLLLSEIQGAGEKLYSIHEVRVLPRFLKKLPTGTRAICPTCNEVYPAKHGPVCRGCGGATPYVPLGCEDGQSPTDGEMRG